VQQQGDEEHALRVVEVGQVDHRDRRTAAPASARPPRRAAPLPPRGERRARDHGVERPREIERSSRGKKVLQRELAHVSNGGSTTAGIRALQRQRRPGGERVAEQAREQDGGRVGQRIGDRGR
jgi:hypothetical protein